MEKIKLGILGMGNMGMGHFQSILDGKCPKIEVTAVSDTEEKRLAAAKEKLPSVQVFSHAEEMLDSKLVNCVLLAVPHYDHPRYAIACFQRGISVMTEKPAGVYARQAREMNEAAEKAGVTFGIMFNQRTNPLFCRAREIVQSGMLGKPKRLVWIVTDWYRTQAYYDSGSWRATWNGEGGGVLLNQAPHNLDLWQWIFGMPKRIRAFCAFGKYHNIDVEDDVTIYGEYENGATGVFITTTGEFPGIWGSWCWKTANSNGGSCPRRSGNFVLPQRRAFTFPRPNMRNIRRPCRTAIRSCWRILRKPFWTAPI